MRLSEYYIIIDIFWMNYPYRKDKTYSIKWRETCVWISVPLASLMKYVGDMIYQEVRFYAYKSGLNMLSSFLLLFFFCGRPIIEKVVPALAIIYVNSYPGSEGVK